MPKFALNAFRKVLSSFIILLLAFGVYMPRISAPVHASTLPFLTGRPISVSNPLLTDSNLSAMFQNIKNMVPNLSEYYYSINTFNSFTYQVRLYPRGQSKLYGWHSNGFTTSLDDINPWFVTVQSGEFPYYDFRMSSTGAYVSHTSSFNTLNFNGSSAGTAIRLYNNSRTNPSHFSNFDTYGIVRMSFGLDANRQNLPTSDYLEQKLPTWLENQLFGSDATLFQLDHIPLHGLGIMITSMLNSLRADSLDSFYYLIRPKMSGELQIGYSIVLVSKANAETYFQWNHFEHTDAEGDGKFEYLALHLQATTDHPLYYFDYDSNFNRIRFAASQSDRYNDDFNDEPVYYANLPVAVNADPLGSIPYIDKSEEILARIKARLLPSESAILYTGIPDVKLGNSSLTIHSTYLRKIYNNMAQGMNTSSSLALNIGYIIIRDGDFYKVYMSQPGSAQLLAEVANPRRDTAGRLLYAKSRVVSWHYHYKAPLTSFGVSSMFFRTYDLEGNFHSEEQILNDLTFEITNSVYYTNISAATHSGKDVFGNVKFGGLPLRLATDYGGHPINLNIYDGYGPPPVIVGKTPGQILRDTIIQDKTIGGVITGTLALFSAIAASPQMFTELLAPLPEPFRNLVVASFSIFMFLAVYRIYRVIRGILI